MNKITLSDIYPYLDYDFSSEHELVETIEQLSKNFTANREQIGEYLKSKKMVAAYSCFYLLTNIPKMDECLKYLYIDCGDLNAFEIFDIGAGPGTFSISLLLKNEKLDIKAIETSNEMANQGKKLSQGLFGANGYTYVNFSQIKPKDKKRLGVFGHSANEMTTKQVQDYIKRLDLDEIIFIEPGTKEFFTKFKEIRSELVSDYHIAYPCHSAHHCPLSEKDWCHQYLKVTHHPEVERLTQLAHKDRRKLPIALSYFKMKNENSAGAENIGTILRVYPATKFSLEWQICFFNGESNEVIDMQVMTRSYKKKEIKELNQVLAGEQIKFEIERKLENNKYRGKLL